MGNLSFQTSISSGRMGSFIPYMDDKVMFEISPIKARIKDLGARTDVLRGYL